MRDKLEKSLHVGSIATALGAAATAADITLFGGAGTLIGMALAGLSIFKEADKDIKDMASLMAPALAEELRRAPISDDQKKIVIELLKDHPPTFADIAQGNHITAHIAKAKRDALADHLKDPAQTARKVMTTFEVVLAAALEPVVTPTDQQTADTAAILQRLEADGEFKRMRDEGITERAIIRLAKRVTQDTQDLSSAWAAIEDIVTTAIRVQQEGHAPSNHRDFVDEVFARTAELAAEGNYVAALDEVNAALDEGEARKLRLLKRGLDMARLAGNAKQAAEFEVARLKLEETPSNLFNALRDLQGEWYVQGRDVGLAFDAMVAIDLAQASVDLATSSDQRGAALNDLGTALATLGERDSDTKRLNEAVTAYRDALKERAREKVPLDWASTQNNLGNALQPLGERDSDTKRLNEAVTAYRDALKEYTREKVPLEWAMTQNNLGNALKALGQRDSDTNRLNEAVTAFRDALKERTHEKVPLEWAMTQSNLAGVELVFFAIDSDQAHLTKALAHLEQARDVYVAAGASYYVDRITANIAEIKSRQS